jgi:hypothetical protein
MKMKMIFGEGWEQNFLELKRKKDVRKMKMNKMIKMMF